MHKQSSEKTDQQKALCDNTRVTQPYVVKAHPDLPNYKDHWGCFHCVFLDDMIEVTSGVLEKEGVTKN